jgi:hypothetical protein
MQGQYAARPLPGKMSRRGHPRTQTRRRLSRRVSGISKAAAQDALKNLRKEIDGGTTKAGSGSYTVRKCCEDWLSGGLPGRDPKTVAKNKFMLEPLLAIIGSVRLGTWTSPTSTTG